jgi:hypothetical protein
MKKVVNASKIIEKGLTTKIANKVQKTTRGIKYRKKTYKENYFTAVCTLYSIKNQLELPSFEKSSDLQSQVGLVPCSAVPAAC